MPETAFSVPLHTHDTEAEFAGPSGIAASVVQEAHSPPAMAHVLLAGGLGGAIGDSVMYPLDTIKTRQQGAPASLAKYRTMASATRAILSQEGLWFGAYRGYTAMLLGSFPSTMLFFGTYETSKRYMKQLNYNDTAVHLTAGLLGDLASSIIYVPSEVIKARFQLQGPYNNQHFISGYNYRSFRDAMVTIPRQEGFGALFYGYKATLMRDLPFSALQFAFYEKFRVQAQEYRHSRDIGLGLELATGAAAGGLAGIITTPLDVIKTRIQTQTDGRIKGLFSGLRYIAINEGMLAVFSGVGPRLVWTSVQSSLMLVLYQTVLRMLENQ